MRPPFNVTISSVAGPRRPALPGRQPRRRDLPGRAHGRGDRSQRDGLLVSRARLLRVAGAAAACCRSSTNWRCTSTMRWASSWCVPSRPGGRRPRALRCPPVFLGTERGRCGPCGGNGPHRPFLCGGEVTTRVAATRLDVEPLLSLDVGGAPDPDGAVPPGRRNRCRCPCWGSSWSSPSLHSTRVALEPELAPELPLLELEEGVVLEEPELGAGVARRGRRVGDQRAPGEEARGERAHGEDVAKADVHGCCVLSCRCSAGPL